MWHTDSLSYSSLLSLSWFSLSSSPVSWWLLKDLNSSRYISPIFTPLSLDDISIMIRLLFYQSSYIYLQWAVLNSGFISNCLLILPVGCASGQPNKYKPNIIFKTSHFLSWILSQGMIIQSTSGWTQITPSTYSSLIHSASFRSANFYPHNHCLHCLCSDF